MKGKLAQIGRRIVAVANRLGVARILSIVLVVAVLVYGCGFLVSYLSIPQQTLTDLPQKGLAPSLGTIRPKSGEVQIASEGNLTLYLDTATLCLRIHDAASGRDFYSMSRDDLVPERAHSPLTLSYRSTGGATGEWDAYTYAIARDQYEIDRIENGVRFKLTLSQGKSYAVNDYLPQKISTERYQTALLDKIDALAEQGVDDKTINSYKKVLNQYYGHDEEAGYHFVKYSGTPSKGMVSILIEMVEAIGYTQDDIVADNGEYNIVSTFSNSAEFVVYMEHTLEDGALVVNVPTYEISCNKEDYRVQKLSVYPAFNCADESKNEGYLFVPDGAGALFPMDSGITTYGDYTRPIYDNTRYGNLYNIRGYKEDTPMPVFGMYHTGGDKTGSGFFAVIESGAELAWYATAIKSAPGQEGGHVYNAAFATFEVMQSASVRVFGPFASQTNSYLVTADPAKMDCTVRYYVVGEDADYATYADIYRNYLVGGDASKLNYNNEAKLYINLLGAVTLKDSILGVPYEIGRAHV